NEIAPLIGPGKVAIVIQTRKPAVEQVEQRNFGDFRSWRVGPILAQGARRIGPIRKEEVDIARLRFIGGVLVGAAARLGNKVHSAASLTAWHDDCLLPLHALSPFDPWALGRLSDRRERRRPGKVPVASVRKAR